MDKPQFDQHAPPPRDVTDERGGIPIVDSRSLFKKHNRLVIKHGNSHYLLQITRQGKLILTR